MRGKPVFLAAAFAASTVFPALAAQPARAQSAQSLDRWSLPAPEASSTASPVQGPVDTQNPVLRPASPEAAAPEPTPSVTPAPVLSPPVDRAASRRAPGNPPPPAREPPAATVPAPVGQPAAPRPTALPDTLPAHAPAASPVPHPAAPAPAASPSPEGDWPVWWVLPAGLAVLAGGLLWLRLRQREATDSTAVPQAMAPPLSAGATPPAGIPSARPPSSPHPEPTRASGDLLFEPVAMRLSLVYATLRFRLVLTARTEIPPGKVLADMIAAHASLPQALQLAPPPEALGLVQAFPRLVPGQVLEVDGELQVPLASVRPLRQGSASFMVPLVRLALLGDDDPALPRLERGFVFTVGLPGDGPALAPLRLDTGPQAFAELAAREIKTARRTTLLGLDPVRAAG